mmetsp:Transcript_70384/g.204098  ORF Transcript_70384/g.204098 Transcript_70384/m.204098 type:complete len:216 (+) Transcript_70384:161-808(+)
MPSPAHSQKQKEKIEGQGADEHRGHRASAGAQERQDRHPRAQHRCRAPSAAGNAPQPLDALLAEPQLGKRSQRGPENEHVQERRHLQQVLKIEAGDEQQLERRDREKRRGWRPAPGHPLRQKRGQKLQAELRVRHRLDQPRHATERGGEKQEVGDGAHHDDDGLEWLPEAAIGDGEIAVVPGARPGGQGAEHADDVGREAGDGGGREADDERSRR